MSCDDSPPSKNSPSKRKRSVESSQTEGTIDEEPEAPLPRFLRPVILPDIDVDAPTMQDRFRIEPLSFATAERTERIGLHDSNVTSIDTLPTEEFLDQIHIHGMRLASAHQPPRFRVLKPSALLGIGIAAQQFILQRLKPLLQDHIASQRPRDAPPEFYDDINDEEQDIGDHIEVESGHSDDQPSTQLPESSNDLLLELPKDIRGRASESGLHETPQNVKQNPDNVPESSEAVDGNISDQEVPSTNKTRKRKERIVVESTAAAERPKRSKKS